MDFYYFKTTKENWENNISLSAVCVKQNCQIFCRTTDNESYLVVSESMKERVKSLSAIEITENEFLNKFN